MLLYSSQCLSIMVTSGNSWLHVDCVNEAMVREIWSIISAIDGENYYVASQHYFSEIKLEFSKESVAFTAVRGNRRISFPWPQITNNYRVEKINDAIKYKHDTVNNLLKSYLKTAFASLVVIYPYSPLVNTGFLLSKYNRPTWFIRETNQPDQFGTLIITRVDKTQKPPILHCPLILIQVTPYCYWEWESIGGNSFSSAIPVKLTDNLFKDSALCLTYNIQDVEECLIALVRKIRQRFPDFVPDSVPINKINPVEWTKWWGHLPYPDSGMIQ